MLENNGVYGLTKGQFSASADVGTRAKRGEVNRNEPIDPVLLALTLGAGFVARSFSGDKAQLVPILKAGLRHRGFALVDVVSPCVAFNDHEGSTKSYRYSREHLAHAVEADLVLPMAQIEAEYDPGDARSVRMHDGSLVRFRKVPHDYDPSDRAHAYRYVRERLADGEVPTGLLHLDPGAPEMHETLGTVDTPLVDLPFEDLCPGARALDALMEEWR